VRHGMRTMRQTILGLLGLVLLALPAWAGMHYTAVTSTEDQQGHSAKLKAEGWVSGDKAKVVFEQSDHPLMKPGSYLLTKDGAHVLYLVNPEDKTYAVWDVNAMLGALGGLMNGMGPILKLEFSDPKVEKLSEEDGGTLLGLPTRHYKFRTSYGMKMKIFGFGSSADTVVDQDVWASKRLADPGFGVWLRSEPPHTGNSQFDKLVSAEAAKLRLEGFPLKTTTVSTTTQKGKQRVSRSTQEVTQLEARSIPDSTFEVPAGYKETQILPAAEPGRRGEG
jgi:hypothetical protein